MSGYSGNVTIGTSTATGYVVFGHSSGWGAGSLTLTGAGSNVLLGDEAATAYNAAWTGGSALSFVAGTLAPSSAITVGPGASLQLMNNTAGNAILFSPVNGITVNGGTLAAKGTAGTSFYVPAPASTWIFGGTALSTVSGRVRLDNTDVVLQVGDAVTTGAGIDTTVTGAISGGNGFTKTGAGTLAVSGVNTHSGTTVVQAGILFADNSFAFGTGPVSVGLAGSASRIQLGNGVDVANALTLNAQAGTSGRGALEVTGTDTGTWSGSITVTSNPAAGGAFYTDAGASLVLTGAISGATPVQRAGNVTYGGGGAYTALIVTGTARVGAPGGIPSGAVVNLGASAAGTLDLNGISLALDGVVKGANAAAITNGGAAPATLTLGAAADRTYAGTIDNGAGGLSLAKQGDSTLTLSGANAYAGTTSVGQGALLINGLHTGGGLISVSALATLGGSGTAGDVDVLDDGILSPGSADTPSDNGFSAASLWLAGNSRMNFDLDAPNPGPNIAASDLVELTGGLRLDGVVHITARAGFGTPAAGDKWLLMTYAGALTDNGATVGTAPALAGGLGYVIDTTTPGSVFLAVVPEPATGLLAAMGILLLFRRQARET
ncbi:MAG: autotransporter-associated beta strand repeat-containing protein [Kiritimatiellia bacterium]